MAPERTFMNWDEVFKWGLKPLGRYECTCRECGERIIYDELGIEETISALKIAGWELRDDGPHCVDCVANVVDIQKGIS